MDRSKYDDHAVGGTQRIYRFDNGYRASVVRNLMSYGGTQGLYELAVLDSKGITYKTPITNDVIGYLTPLGVRAVLRSIQTLPTIDK